MRGRESIQHGPMSSSEPETPIALLLVEDNPSDVQLLRTLLTKAADGKFALTVVARVDAALQAIATHRFDVVILDLSLPDAEGMTAFERVQRAAPELPVLILSGFSDEQAALKLLQSGIQDYLVKGQADGPAIWRALRYAIERKRMQQNLSQLAQYDHLTGLPNRNLLSDRLTQALLRASRGKKGVAVMFLDLDRFKQINDGFGHSAGDQLLVSVADRLTRCLRREDTVARFAGDEFVVILEGIADGSHSGVVAEKILRSLSAPLVIDGKEMHIPISIGIAVYPQDGADKETLMRNADAAMYQAKNDGGNSVRFYESCMNERSYERLMMQNALRPAMERKELALYYQPVYALDAGRIVGLEALLRWRHPSRGLLLPADFMRLMEETGIIVPVGEWVLRTACAQYQSWRRAGLPPVGLQVNLSARQLGQSGFTDFVERTLRETAIDPTAVTLELSENTLMENARQANDALKALHALGLRLSVDDFGTGYSSLPYLKRFAVHTLKIDRSLVADLPHNSENVVIVRAIINLAHDLRLKTIAEGVETPEQLAFLRAHGCDQAQGFLFSAPLVPEEVPDFVADPSRGWPPLGPLA